MRLGSEPRPFQADLGGDLFADDPSAHENLACLP